MIDKNILIFFTKEAKKQREESKEQERARKEAIRRYGLVSVGGTLAPLPFVLPMLRDDLQSSRGYSKEDSLRLVPDLAKQYDGTYKHVKDIAEYSGKRGGGYVGPHYMEAKNIKNVSVGNKAPEAVLAHELGHATGELKAPTRALMIGGRVAGLGAQFSNAYNLGRLGLDHYGIVDDNVEKDERLSNIQTGFGVQGVGSMGTLAEEGRASIRAMQSGLKRGKGIEYAKVLAPAYGTYMVPTAVAGAGYYGVKKYREAGNK